MADDDTGREFWRIAVHEASHTWAARFADRVQKPRPSRFDPDPDTDPFRAGAMTASLMLLAYLYKLGILDEDDIAAVILRWDR